MQSEFSGTPRQFVLIVGQCPAFSNVDQYKAFVGTRSGEKLFKWIETLGIQNGTMVNASDEFNTTSLKHINYQRFADIYKSKPIDKVIALGNYASKALTRMKIEHFKLPHPSGKNRQLNSLGFIETKLKECEQYLYPVSTELTPGKVIEANDKFNRVGEEETSIPDGNQGASGSV